MSQLNDDGRILMPDLKYFRLSYNQFKGTFPGAAAWQLSRAEQLWMAGNQFSGELPTQLGLFSNLGKFSVIRHVSEYPNLIFLTSLLRTLGSIPL